MTICFLFLISKIKSSIAILAGASNFENSGDMTKYQIHLKKETAISINHNLIITEVVNLEDIKKIYCEEMRQGCLN
ncbi:hypothetical protein YTPLAS73_15120 [Nitrosarchaeum sp.]|nr:hypothetical protein YTPLAS73_15120 [Nitrosarchaeum sp.]